MLFSFEIYLHLFKHRDIINIYLYILCVHTNVEHSSFPFLFDIYT